MNVPVTRIVLLRLAAITAGALVFASLMPAPAGSSSGRMDVGIAVFVAVTLGFLVSSAVDRRRRLLETINLELNKLRRIYHLSKNLSEADQRFRSWFTDLHGNLYAYMSFFSENDFGKYEKGNAKFREVSYHIYTVPEIASKKEESLYDELLRTTAVVAESRQRIKEMRDARMSPYSWVVVLLLAAGYILSVMVSTADTATSRLVSGVSIAVVLLVLDLLWEVDTLSSERESLARRYVTNVGRLELRRREDEE